MLELKAVIIEDEEDSRLTLRKMLNGFCKGVEVVGESGSVRDGIKTILERKPDIVFLDIELPQASGFDLLDYFPLGTFEVIFTTAYNQYAVKAFKLSAIDYLLKPIDLEELRAALEKAREKKSFDSTKEKMETLKNNLNNTFKKLSLPTQDGLLFVELKDVVRCEASSNYTCFYLLNGKKIVVSRTLRFYDELLSDFNFFRINRTDLINLNHVDRYTRQKRPIITLTDGTELYLSENKKNEFLEKANIT